MVVLVQVVTSSSLQTPKSQLTKSGLFIGSSHFVDIYDVIA